MSLSTNQKFLAYTDQADLIKALHDPTSDVECAAAAIEVKRIACEGIDAFMEQHGVDIVATPSDSTLVSWAACSGEYCHFTPLHFTPPHPTQLAGSA